MGDIPQPDVTPVVTAVGPPPPAATAATARRALLPSPAQVAWIFAAAVAVLVVAYLVLNVPGRWFSSVPTLSWSARQLALTRGAGTVQGDEVHVTAPDASGLAVLSVDTGFRSVDYPVIEWAAIDVPDGADVRLLWRTDYTPGKVSSIGLVVESGRVRPALVAGNGEWIGTIRGLALAIRYAGSETVRVRGVIAKPASMGGVLRDRFGEWLAFEGWSGTSINSVTGGADIQDLPLPLLFAGAALLACAIVAVVARRRGASMHSAVAVALAISVLAGWAVLDARWMWNLARQVDVSAKLYAGKTSEQKHLEAEDGPLYLFIERARAIMPATPVRVFVAAEAHYFRGRAAFHLYPHNVYLDPYHDVLPPAAQLRPGDWVVIYRRRGVQYDPARHRLRLGNAEIPAELKLAEQGAALFLVVAP
jgi:hypothetical protein